MCAHNSTPNPDIRETSLAGGSVDRVVAGLESIKIQSETGHALETQKKENVMIIQDHGVVARSAHGPVPLSKGKPVRVISSRRDSAGTLYYAVHAVLQNGATGRALGYVPASSVRPYQTQAPTRPPQIMPQPAPSRTPEQIKPNLKGIMIVDSTSVVARSSQGPIALKKGKPVKIVGSRRDAKGTLYHAVHAVLKNGALGRPLGFVPADALRAFSVQPATSSVAPRPYVPLYPQGASPVPQKPYVPLYPQKPAPVPPSYQRPRTDPVLPYYPEPKQRPQVELKLSPDFQSKFQSNYAEPSKYGLKLKNVGSQRLRFVAQEGMENFWLRRDNGSVREIEWRSDINGSFNGSSYKGEYVYKGTKTRATITSSDQIFETLSHNFAEESRDLGLSRETEMQLSQLPIRRNEDPKYSAYPLNGLVYLPQLTVDGKTILKFTNGTMTKYLNASILRPTVALAKAFYKETGQPLVLTSVYRTHQHQQYLYDNQDKPGFNPAARPGNSQHNNAIAVDINQVSRTKFSSQSAFRTFARKYGFDRPVSGENWHFEHIASRELKSKTGHSTLQVSRMLGEIELVERQAEYRHNCIDPILYKAMEEGIGHGSTAYMELEEKLNALLKPNENMHLTFDQFRAKCNPIYKKILDNTPRDIEESPAMTTETCEGVFDQNNILPRYKQKFIITNDFAYVRRPVSTPLHKMIKGDQFTLDILDKNGRLQTLMRSDSGGDYTLNGKKFTFTGGEALCLSEVSVPVFEFRDGKMGREQLLRENAEWFVRTTERLNHKWRAWMKSQGKEDKFTPLTPYDVMGMFNCECYLSGGKISHDRGTHSEGEKGLLPLASNLADWHKAIGANAPRTRVRTKDVRENVLAKMEYLLALKNVRNSGARYCENYDQFGGDWKKEAWYTCATLHGRGVSPTIQKKINRGEGMGYTFTVRGKLDKYREPNIKGGFRLAKQAIDKFGFTTDPEKTKQQPSHQAPSVVPNITSTEPEEYSLEEINNTISQIPGDYQVIEMASNGGRPVAIVVPEATDLSRPVDLMYYFHGLRGGIVPFLNGSDEGPGLASTITKISQNPHGNVVFVIPQGPPDSHHPSWMRTDSQKFQNDVQQSLLPLAPNNINISTSTLIGHSAAGKTILNMVTNGMEPDNVWLLDASYGDQAEQVHDKLVRAGRVFEMNIVYKEGGPTEESAEKLREKNNVYVYATNHKHGEIPFEFLERPEFLMGGIASEYNPPRYPKPPQQKPAERVRPPEELRINTGPHDRRYIGNKIMKNEMGSDTNYMGLTSWNEKEPDFPSLGIGHFIWYIEGRTETYKESFPLLIEYIRQNRTDIEIPSWLLDGDRLVDNPWNHRSEFMAERNSNRMKQLRTFLKNNPDPQVLFIQERAETAIVDILDHLSPYPNIQEQVRHNLESLIRTREGRYALLDLVNWKGEGLIDAEKFDGPGGVRMAWGLLPVLLHMDRATSPEDARAKFASAVHLITANRRVVLRGEDYYDNFRNRSNTYHSASRTKMTKAQLLSYPWRDTPDGLRQLEQSLGGKTNITRHESSDFTPSSYGSRVPRGTDIVSYRTVQCTKDLYNGGAPGYNWEKIVDGKPQRIKSFNKAKAKSQIRHLGIAETWDDKRAFTHYVNLLPHGLSDHPEGDNLYNAYKEVRAESGGTFPVEYVNLFMSDHGKTERKNPGNRLRSETGPRGQRHTAYTLTKIMLEGGKVFINCMNGMHRAPSATVLTLVATGQADTWDEAIEKAHLSEADFRGSEYWLKTMPDLTKKIIKETMVARRYFESLGYTDMRTSPGRELYLDILLDVYQDGKISEGNYQDHSFYTEALKDVPPGRKRNYERATKTRPYGFEVHQLPPGSKPMLLCSGGQPGFYTTESKGFNTEFAISQLEELHKKGVRHIITTNSEGRTKVEGYVEATNKKLISQGKKEKELLKHEYISVSTSDGMDNMGKRILELQDEGAGVYIHCTAGKHRAPGAVMVAMLYLGAQSYEEAKALAVLDESLYDGRTTKPFLEDKLIPYAKNWKGAPSASHESVAVLEIPQLIENSGIAPSFNTPNAIWTHNDSDNSPTLYLVSTKPGSQSGKTLATIKIPESINADWEDIATFQISGVSYIAIGDFGNNRGTKECQICILQEPPRMSEGSKQELTYATDAWSDVRFAYQGGPRDCESLAYDPAGRGRFLMFEKDASGTTQIFELPMPKKEYDASAQLPLAKEIATIKAVHFSAMDISRDGTKLFARAYDTGYLFTRGTGESWEDVFAKPLPHPIQLPKQSKGEGVCFEPDGKSILLSSEGKNQPLYRVTLDMNDIRRASVSPSVTQYQKPERAKTGREIAEDFAKHFKSQYVKEKHDDGSITLGGFKEGYLGKNDKWVTGDFIEDLCHPSLKDESIVFYVAKDSPTGEVQWQDSKSAFVRLLDGNTYKGLIDNGARIYPTSDLYVKATGREPNMLPDQLQAWKASRGGGRT